MAAVDAASDALVADAETSAVLLVPRPAAMAGTSVDSDTVIRIRAAIAWASVASPTTMVFPAAFARNALLGCLRGRTFGGKCQTQRDFIKLCASQMANGETTSFGCLIERRTQSFDFHVRVIESVIENANTQRPPFDAGA